MKGTWDYSIRNALTEICISTGSRPFYFSRHEKDKLLACLDYLREYLKERANEMIRYEENQEDE